MATATCAAMPARRRRAALRDVLRGSDLKCRYGGEEFLVLLPDTPVEGARRVADTHPPPISDGRLSGGTNVDHDGELRRRRRRSARDRHASVHRPRRRRALSRERAGPQLRLPVDRAPP